MRLEREFNFKRLWFCYKIINLYKVYICLFLWNSRNDFVIFKIDYIGKRFFTIVFMHLTFYMWWDGKIRRLFFYKEKKFKHLLDKVDESL